MDNANPIEEQQKLRVHITNLALVVLSACSAVLSFPTFDVYMSAAGLDRFGSSLAGVMCLALFVGYYCFWDWTISELTDPDISPSERGGIYKAMIFGLVLIFGVSSIANFKTMYASTARQLEMAWQRTEISRLAESLQILTGRVSALGTRLESISRDFERASNAETQQGVYSSVPGPGGVTFQFDSVALRAIEQTEIVSTTLVEIEVIADSISHASLEAERIIHDTGLNSVQRQIAFENTMQLVRKEVLTYQSVLPIESLRMFTDQMLTEPVMPALSTDADIAAKQRDALRQKLPQLYREVALPLDAVVSEVEADLTALSLPDSEPQSDTVLVFKWIVQGIEVAIAAFGIDAFPLIILLIRKAGMDARRIKVHPANVEVEHSPKRLTEMYRFLNKAQEKSVAADNDRSGLKESHLSTQRHAS